MTSKNVLKTCTSILVVFSFIFSSYSQDKKEMTPDELFRKFGDAFLERNLEVIKNISVYTENLDVIAKLPKLPQAQLNKAKKELASLPIKWYLPGENIKIHGSHIKVNDVMSNDRKRIGNIKMLDMVYPIALKKSRTGKWQIDPFLMVQSITKSIEIEQKKNRRNFRIDINGEVLYLNEGEKVAYKDKHGNDHQLSLYKNEVQHYRDGRVAFQYHRDMEVFPGKGKNCFVYTMNSDLSPEVHVLVFEKGAKLGKEMQRFINIWIENYKSKNAVFEKTMLKNTKQIINGKEHAGKILYVNQQGVVYYNQFYFFEEKGVLMGLFARSKTTDTGLLNQYLSILSESVYPVKGKK